MAKAFSRFQRLDTTNKKLCGKPKGRKLHCISRANGHATSFSFM